MRFGVAVLAGLGFGAAQALACGTERWSVKTGTDSDARSIDLRAANHTTISHLIGLAKPDKLPADSRISPTETTIYKLSVTLKEYKRETDKDYHLVLFDSDGNHMIMEIPDPTCVDGASNGSPFYTGIKKARAAFDAVFTPTSSMKTTNTKVTISGCGFFDFVHGQDGVADNGIEIHPIIDIEILSVEEADPNDPDILRYNKLIAQLPESDSASTSEGSESDDGSDSDTETAETVEETMTSAETSEGTSEESA